MLSGEFTNPNESVFHWNAEVTAKVRTSAVGLGIFRHFMIRFQNDSWSTFFPQLIILLCKYILTKIAVSMLFVYSWNLCVSTAILKIWVWIFTGFTIQFNYDYHYQLNITMRHILSFQYYCTQLHFHIHFISNLFCAKFTLFFYYISRLL